MSSSYIIAGACLMILLAGCQSTTPVEGNIKTFYVGPAMQDGEGVGPMVCLMVKDSPDSDYRLFYSPIRGFDYVPGFEYEIKVNVTERDNVPADASKFTYELIEVVSAKPAGLALEGVKWELKDRIPETQVDARFEAGQLSGSGGVNRYFTGYEVEGTSIRIGQAGSTMMAGPQAWMEQEQVFLKALGMSTAYRIVGEELRLLDEEGTSVLIFSPTEEPWLFPNTWTATGINNGKGGVASLLSGTAVTIRFNEDGSVSGSGGCNRFNGAFKLDGDALKIGPLASTRRMCVDPDGIMEQEANVLEALENVSQFRIDGRTLELRDENGALQVKCELMQP